MAESTPVLPAPLLVAPSALPAQPGSPAAAAGSRLGPAEVVEAGAAASRVRFAEAPERTVVAAHAFSLPFTPRLGDTLLVVGAGDAWFAVGVLAGSRPASLQFPGDVELRAVGGTLTLASDCVVAIEAPKVTLRTGVLRTIARSLVEKAEQVHRWVRGLCTLRAGQSRRTIDGEDQTRCGESVTLAKGVVRIDGDQLHLGH